MFISTNNYNRFVNGRELREAHLANKCGKEVLTQCALEELRHQFAVDSHPRHIELSPRRIFQLPIPRWKTQFVLAKRTDLLRRDWMRYTLSLAGQNFGLTASRWEKTARHIFRVANHFLRSESWVSDPPDLAAAVLDPMRYQWRVRTRDLQPTEAVKFPPGSESYCVRLNNHVTVRTGDIQFATVQALTRRMDYRILERQLLNAQFDQRIRERVIFGAESNPYFDSYLPALESFTHRTTGLQETPLVSFIRFLPNDRSFQILRFSVQPDGKGLIYVRRTSGLNLYLTLTEPYDLVGALVGLCRRHNYMLL